MQYSMAVPEKTDVQHTETLAAITETEEHQQSHWQAIKRNHKAVAWATLLIWVMCLQGFDNQAGGIVVGIKQFRKDFGSPYDGDYVLPADWQSAFNGAPYATAVFGAIFGSWVADCKLLILLTATQHELTQILGIGRKWTVVGGVCNTFIGVALEYIATTKGVFFGGKMINGVSIGLFNAVCVTYVTEIVPLALRGIFTSACNLSLCLGPFICVLIGDGYADLENRWAYVSHIELHDSAVETDIHPAWNLRGSMGICRYRNHLCTIPSRVSLVVGL